MRLDQFQEDTEAREAYGKMQSMPGFKVMLDVLRESFMKPLAIRPGSNLSGESHAELNGRMIGKQSVFDAVADLTKLADAWKEAAQRNAMQETFAPDKEGANLSVKKKEE